MRLKHESNVKSIFQHQDRAKSFKNHYDCDIRILTSNIILLHEIK